MYKAMTVKGYHAFAFEWKSGVHSATFQWPWLSTPIRHDRANVFAVNGSLSYGTTTTQWSARPVLQHLRSVKMEAARRNSKPSDYIVIMVYATWKLYLKITNGGNEYTAFEYDGKTSTPIWTSSFSGSKTIKIQTGAGNVGGFGGNWGSHNKYGAHPAILKNSLL